ncbi:MAG: sugar phosphate isomerase/epimerase [Kiritimatiellaeota bacterium]|nr:sugar phosphate isomerase/epimerase [Kiritimatiellota bacterium]
MSKFKIGVMADSFRLSPREGILKAREVGAEGFQLYVVEGEVTPEAMDAEARREFRQFVAGAGLQVAALCGDLGGHGFQRADENAGKIERSKRIVDLAIDLGTAVVTTHIGVVPADASSQTYANMQHACNEIGAYAADRGVRFAVETGPETAVRLKSFLDSLDTDGVGVNLDPANLVMVTGDDPVAAVHTLAPYIVHTHAKDGVKLAPCNPEEVYNAFAEGGVEGLDFGKLFNEMPLGEGAVDFEAWVRALADIGYEGFLTIEREVGRDPERDIRAAVQFLRELLDRLGV